MTSAKADYRSILNTDADSANVAPGQDFSDYRMVDHEARGYVKDDGETHTQTVESFFAIMMRGVMGSFHGVSEQHLQRYTDEFAFLRNARSALGIEDEARAAKMVARRLRQAPSVQSTS
jgi:ISXO2-like transposase domain